MNIEAYSSPSQLDAIIALIEKDLSEPYTIYTYRYFIAQWPQFTLLALLDNECIGVVICRLEPHQGRLSTTSRGYIAMLAVSKIHRKKRIGRRLVENVISRMKEEGAEEVVLETETSNLGALGLYEGLGFVRDKKLQRYYMTGDAYRLKLYL